VLPSRYVTDFAPPPRPDWSLQIRESFRAHGKVVAPAVVQEALVRELLINDEVVRFLLSNIMDTRLWHGDAMLTTIHDVEHTAAALLLVDELPTRKSIVVPWEVKHAALVTSRGALERFTALLSQGTEIRLDQDHYLIPHDEELELLPTPLVVAKKPRLEFTLAVGDPVFGPQGAATIGLPARHKGKPGFLTVEHALGKADADVCYRLKDGTRCKVTRRSRYWDAAFVACDQQIRSTLKWNSIMKAHAPGRGTPAHFIAGSAPKRATIDSVDPILPRYSVQIPTGIARVYTNRCTEPGDSGAVLVDDERGAVIGQATTRTAEGEQLEYSVWLWMAGVLDAVEAQPLGE
jgi:hypothetical protein